MLNIYFSQTVINIVLKKENGATFEQQNSHFYYGVYIS